MVGGNRRVFNIKLKMEQKITTNEVKSDSPIDYDRLIDEFGSKRIDQTDLQLLNQVIEKRQLSANQFDLFS